MRELQRLAWSAARTTSSTAAVAPTRSATRWCAAWSGRCWTSAADGVAWSFPAELLRRGVRASEVPVAPAHGLTLVGVDYPPAAELAARADATRQVRV